MHYFKKKVIFTFCLYNNCTSLFLDAKKTMGDKITRGMIHMKYLQLVAITYRQPVIYLFQLYMITLTATLPH